MYKLNLPPYPLKLKKNRNKKLEVLDPLRKKYVVLTPEEWVRQNFIEYLADQKHYPKSLMQSEVALKINRVNKRADIVLYGNQGQAVLLVECKAPEVKITQEVFDQAARYNMVFNVKYMVITNGLQHYCCEMDHLTQSYHFMEEIPPFDKISSLPNKVS